MRAWIHVHGQLPHERDWERAEEGRPCARTVRRRWGWYELMADALDVDLAEILELQGQVDERGAMPRRPRRLRGDLLGAIIAYRDRWDCWPSGNDWERATFEHPARRTYVRCECSAAGGSPSRRRRRSGGGSSGRDSIKRPDQRRPVIAAAGEVKSLHRLDRKYAVDVPPRRVPSFGCPAHATSSEPPILMVELLVDGAFRWRVNRRRKQNP